MKLLGPITLVYVGASAFAAAELAKRSLVGDVISGFAEIVRAGKLDFNSVMLGSVEILRNVSYSIDFEKAVNKGISNAIDQNSELPQIPFGKEVGNATKVLLAGIDWNTLIRSDTFNFLDGSMREVDANAVVASGLDTLSAVVDEPILVPSPTNETAGSPGTSRPGGTGARPGSSVLGQVPASAAAYLATPFSSISVAWYTAIAVCALATLHV